MHFWTPAMLLCVRARARAVCTHRRDFVAFSHMHHFKISRSGHKFAKYDGKTNNFTDEADTLNCALAITPKYTLSKMH